MKQLNAELRRITEQVAAQEKEYGSREYVLSEYRRRRVEFDQANSEVCNLQRSLKVVIIEIEITFLNFSILFFFFIVENGSNG